MADVLFEAESVAPAALPATIDAPTTAAWISSALAGAVPLPEPIVNQLACCLRGAKPPRASRAAA